MAPRVLKMVLLMAASGCASLRVHAIVSLSEILWPVTRRRQLIATFFICAIIADLIAAGCGLGRKLCWAVLSAAITLTGYAVYLSQMFPPPGGTAVKPEPLSWAMFGFLTATGGIVQIAQGANAGSWCLVLTTASCFIIAVWSYGKWGSEWEFLSLHKYVALGACTLCAGSVVVAKDADLAMLSAVCATVADLVSYAPTFRKGWLRPYEDSVTNFAFNSAKCIPALFALQSYSIATMIYLLMLTVVNGGFAVFLLLRRGAIRSRPTVASPGMYPSSGSPQP